MIIAVVLGNRMQDDGTPTQIMLKRMQLTLQAHQKFAFDKIIVSGGVANKKAGKSEASFMKAHLVANGIDEDIIVMEDKSLTTVENAKFSVPLAMDMGATQIVVITTADHMSRNFLNPLKLFKKQLKGYSNVALYGYCLD